MWHFLKISLTNLPCLLTAYIFSCPFGTALAGSSEPAGLEWQDRESGHRALWNGPEKQISHIPPKPSRAGEGWDALETCSAQLRPHLQKQLLPMPTVLSCILCSFQLSRLSGSPFKQDFTATLKPHPRTAVPWGVEQVWYDVKERKFWLDAGKPDLTPHSVPYNSLEVDAPFVGVLTEHCPDQLWRNFFALVSANK